MHRFNPDNRHRLLSEQRYALLPPDRVLDVLALAPTMTVGDIGCGPGFFTLPLAERLTEGQVYAVDVEPVMLQMVQERAGEAGLTNIQTFLAEEQAVPLPAASLDAAFLALVYHEFTDRVGYLSMLSQLVRPGSWLALIEWERRDNPIGGPPLHERITPDEARLELATAGWHVTAQHAFNDWMYMLVAERTEGIAR